MNITMSTVYDYHTILNQNLLEQLKKSILSTEEDGEVSIVQTFTEDILSAVNNLSTSNDDEESEKDAIILFFKTLKNDMKYSCSRVFIDCKEDKATKYLSVFNEKINDGKSIEYAIMIANNDIGEGFSIEHYFNKPCNFAPMFTSDGYQYYTYASQIFTYKTAQILSVLEEYIREFLYLRYEMVKYPAVEDTMADWDFVIVIHAITKEQKDELIDFETQISKEIQ